MPTQILNRNLDCQVNPRSEHSRQDWGSVQALMLIALAININPKSKKPVEKKFKNQRILRILKD